jgi:lysophospholipase L1-like esterase
MKFKKILLVFLIGIILGLSLSPLTDKLPIEALLSPEEKVLGSEDQLDSQFADLMAEPTPVPKKTAKPIPSPKATSSPKPTPEPQFSTYNKEIKVAVFGDSMSDTMGAGLPFLRASLRNYYPQAQLKLYNYAIGCQNIEMALGRIEESYSYRDRNNPPLKQIKPDIVILGSFSYNPFKQGEDEIYRHWANFAKLVDWVKRNTEAKVVILAEIAPNKAKFGQGPKGVNWPADFAWEHALLISQYLENTISFAQANKIPLANAYHYTLATNGEGKLDYISTDDHLHQNTLGNSIIAQLLAQQIYDLGLFK